MFKANKLMDENNQAEIRKEQQVEVDDDFTEITSTRVEKARREMKNGKATGPHNQPVEVSVEEFGKNWGEFSEGGIE